MCATNKNVVRRVFDEVWNTGEQQIAYELFAPTYTHHDSSIRDAGRVPESEKKRVAIYRNAFPDLRF